MKYYLILSFTLLAFSIKAQEDVTKYLTEVKKNVTSDLIPYQNGEKWGYLNRNSLKVVVKPLFKSATLFLNGKAYVELDESFFYLTKQGSLEKAAPPPDEAMQTDEPEIIDKPGWKGFNVDKNSGKLKSYPNVYLFANPQTFRKNSEFYTTVVSEKGKGIIDSQGKIYSIFDFGKFEDIQFHTSIDNKHFVILYSDKMHHYWAMNELGKKYDLGIYDDVFFTNEWLRDYEKADNTLQYLKATKNEKVFFINLNGVKYLPK